MSGSASVALAVWVVFFPPLDIYGARTLLWVAVVTCFLFASYQIWVKERDAREKEAARLKAEHEQKVCALQSELDKLTAHKLTFELAAPLSGKPCSQVTVKGDIDEFTVVLHLYIRFNNSDAIPRVVRSVNLALMKRNEDNTASEIPLTEKRLYIIHVEHDQRVEHDWNNRNISVKAGELTLYHTIQGHITVKADYRKTLDANCFLRVSMQAMNQKLSTLDFNVSWENINRGWIDITPRM